MATRLSQSQLEKMGFLCSCAIGLLVDGTEDSSVMVTLPSVLEMIATKIDSTLIEVSLVFYLRKNSSTSKKLTDLLVQILSEQGFSVTAPPDALAPQSAVLMVKFEA